MTDLKTLIEKKIERDAENFYKVSKWVPTEWAVMNYMQGANSMKDHLLKLVEALEFVLKQGISHFDDCISLTESEGDEYCDCGAIKAENKAREAIENFKREMGE